MVPVLEHHGGPVTLETPGVYEGLNAIREELEMLAQQLRSLDAQTL